MSANKKIYDDSLICGNLISENVQDCSHKVPYFSYVYEKENSFYKYASTFLIENECRFLKGLEEYNYFPKILSKGNTNRGSYIELSRIEGTDFESFFSTYSHQRIKYIKAFIQELFNVLLILYNHQILHRDITHKNIIIKQKNKRVVVCVIDFGWAIYLNEKNICKNPDGLAWVYKCPNGFSDFYSMGVLLNLLVKKYCGDRPYVIRIANALLDISGPDYETPDIIKKKLDSVKLAIDSRQNIVDIRRECGLLFRWAKSLL